MQERPLNHPCRERILPGLATESESPGCDFAVVAATFLRELLEPVVLGRASNSRQPR